MEGKKKRKGRNGREGKRRKGCVGERQGREGGGREERGNKELCLKYICITPMYFLAQPIGSVVPVFWPHMRDMSWIRVFFPLMLERMYNH